MKNITIDKHAFLQAIDFGLEFYKYVIPELEQLDEEKCKSIHNPFYEDKNPSLSIYFDKKKGRWLYKDHGTPPNGQIYYGDVFDFANNYYNHKGLKLKFGELMEEMSKDLEIVLEKKVMISEYNQDFINDSEFENHLAWSNGFDLCTNQYEKHLQDATGYFSKFGITQGILQEYNVKCVKKYVFIDKNGFIKKRKISNGQTVIAYERPFFAKLYSPDPKAFWYIGKKPKDYIFGFDEILNRIRRTKDYDRDILIVTGGEKDVLTLASLGYDAVCFNSETASIPKDANEILFHWFKKIIILYDNDSTGIRNSNKIVEMFGGEFNISAVSFPQEFIQAGGKDVSDYVKLGFDVDILNNLIENTEAFTSKIVEDPAFEISSNKEAGEIEPIDYSPTIPESVYENLPHFFKSLCSLFTDPREKDIILLSLLGVTSSFLPKIKGFHDGKKVGSNLYLFVSAPASSGKGVMNWSRSTGREIQNFLKEKYTRELKKYKADLCVYHEELTNNPDAEEPVEPKIQAMFIPANTSVSMMIQLLGGNENFGIIFETEGDTLANSLKNDWGNFSEVLRSAFHHETVSMARRKNNEFIEIEKPQLSVVLSGTPQQVCNLLNSVENGFFSRFLFYDFRASMQWKTQFSDQDNQLEISFEEASKKVLEYWELQRDSDECIICLEQKHIEELDEYLSNKLFQLFGQHGDPVVASVRRACLMCYRIAMILSVFRWLQKGEKLPKSISASDEDFESALKIIDTLLYHLQAVYNRVESSSDTNKLKPQPRMLFEALPHEFSREKFDSIADELKIKYKTAERYLSIFLKSSLIGRIDQGQYRRL